VSKAVIEKYFALWSWPVSFIEWILFRSEQLK